MRIPPEPFGLFISLKGTVTLLILQHINKNYLIFAEPILKMIFLFIQLFDLISQGDVGQK